MSAPPITASRRGGFTLVELLVVMAIIIMAAGMMAPKISEFFNKRAVETVKGEIVSACRVARLKAVSEGRNISVVFFQEGPRVFDELSETFVNPDWTPAGTSLARDKSTFYLLGFAGRLKSRIDDYSRKDFTPASPYVPPFEWWEERQTALRNSMKEGGVARASDQYRLDGIARVTFHRDGTLTFGPGSTDVPTAVFREDPPRLADVIVVQLFNRSISFIDFKATGAAGTKTIIQREPVMMEDPILSGVSGVPAREADEDEEDE